MRLRVQLIRFTLICAALCLPSTLAYAHTSTETWRVCFYNFADVNLPTLASMQVELTNLLHNRGILLEQGPCASTSRRAVHVVLRKKAPPREPPILGRAPLRQGRVLPVLEVYVEPLVGLMGATRSSNAVGRALARVAAHEVRHFIGQEHNHSDRGLMRAHFSGRELLAEDSHPFREK